ACRDSGAAGDAGGRRPDSGSARRPGGRARLRRARDRACARREAAAAIARLSALRRGRAGTDGGLMLVDSHCHLDFPDFADELDAVIARAAEAGVGAMVTICTKVREFERVLAVAERFDNVWCSVG